MSGKRWILLFVLGCLMMVPAFAQDYDAEEAILPHCDPCTGGVDDVLLPCDDWQTVPGETGPGGSGDVDVAYQFDASAGTTYIFSFCEEGGGALFDSGLSIWGAACTGSALACNDDFCGLESRLEWIAPSSGTFVVRVGGFGGNVGPFTLAYRGVGESCGGIRVMPADSLSSDGPTGGPFDPPGQSYDLSNQGDAPVDYEVSRTQDWVSLDDGSGPGDGPLSGTLAAAETITIDVLIDEDADTLPVGIFTDTVVFSNVTDGSGDTTRDVSLRTFDPGAPQLMVNGDFEAGDLSGWMVFNTGSGDFRINDGVAPVIPEGPIDPCRGNFGAVTEQSGPGTHTLVQEVTLLPGFDIVTLGWVDRIRNHAGIFQDPDQEFRVEILDTSNNVLREVFSTGPGDIPLAECMERFFDISEFAEQTIRIAFTEQDTFFFFNAHVDDVTLTLGRSNIPPTAEAGADQILECSVPGGAIVTLDGSESTDPDSTPDTNDDIVVFEWFEDFGLPTETLLGSEEILTTLFPLGPALVPGETPIVTGSEPVTSTSHLVTLRVTDSAGATDTDEVTVLVRDTTPPDVEIFTFPMVLWPPNHRLAQVSAVVNADDICSPTTTILTSLTSDEPDDGVGIGDGHTTGDIRDADVGTADFDFRLRAERAGTGDGRVYSVVYSATDMSGNETTETAGVFVPHNRDGVTEPMMMSVTNKPSGTSLEWDDVDGALYYNVIRGNLADLRETDVAIDLGTVSCIKAGSLEPHTVGSEDAATPAPDEVFFYLVEYFDGWNTSFGTATADKPRSPSSGACE